MKQSRKDGFSLIENMVAILTLLALVLGGAAVMYQSEGSVQRQQTKREAVVAANHILERYWNTTYSELGKLSNSTISRTMTVNGNASPVVISISAEQTDADGGRYYEMQVAVSFTPEEVITTQTRRYRRGLSKVAK